MLSSELYYSVLDDDERAITRAVNHIFPVLVGYLVATQGASHYDSVESTQISIIQTVEKIRLGLIKEPEKLPIYLKKAARHNYLRIRDKGNTLVFDDSADYSVEPPQQARQLISDEKRMILRACLDRLDPFNREFIEYWLRNPGVRAEEVALVFKSSANAVIQRKHRLVKLLHQCAQEKLNR